MAFLYEFYIKNWVFLLVWQYRLPNNLVLDLKLSFNKIKGGEAKPK